MLPQSIILWFIIGSFVLLVIGLIIRNSGENKANGKDMKQIGVAMLIFGVAFVCRNVFIRPTVSIISVCQ